MSAPCAPPRDEAEVTWTHVACPLCAADVPEPLLVDTVRLRGRAYRFSVVRCRACGIAYVTPRGVGAVLGNVHGGGAWRSAATTNAPIYDAGLHVMRAHGLRDGARLLDIGCGYGDFLVFAAGRGHTVAGVELNPGLAAAARERGLDVRLGDVRAIELEDRFDAVTLWDVVEHVDDPVGLLRAAAAVLQPGGLLWLHTGNARFQLPKARLLGAVRPSGGPYLASHQHLTHFDPQSARRALRAAGLVPLAAVHAGTLHYSRLGKRALLGALNACLGLPARFGGPLLTSSMGVLARRIAPRER